MKSTAQHFTNSQPRPSPKGRSPNSSTSFNSGQGDNHPPRNMIDVSVEIRIMFMYSARQNTANATPEYSTWKPATISDSPSATSNGWRLVSAIPDTRYTTANGSNGHMYQYAAPPSWPRTMSLMFKLDATMSTPTSAKPMAISYDTICAAERRQPRKAYLEFDAQPARITP